MEIFLNDGSKLLTFLPAIEISPEVTLSKPAINLNVVDLPQPEGPNKTTNSPSSTFIFQFSTALISPQNFETLLISIKLILYAFSDRWSCMSQFMVLSSIESYYFLE